MVTEGVETADQGPGTVAADTWFHFGMTWPGNGNRFEVYIDGVYKSTSTHCKSTLSVSSRDNICTPNLKTHRELGDQTRRSLIFIFK